MAWLNDSTIPEAVAPELEEEDDKEVWWFALEVDPPYPEVELPPPVDLNSK